MDRRRRRIVLESLEDRSLLSTVGLARTVHVSVVRTKVVAVTGSWSGTFGPQPNGTEAVNGDGTVKGVGPVYAVGVIQQDLMKAKSGTRITGFISLYASGTNQNVANLNLSGVVPRAFKTKVPLTLGLNGNGVGGGLPQSLKGTAITTIMTMNQNGTGQYKLSFNASGRK